MRSRKFDNSGLNCCRFVLSKLSCGCVGSSRGDNNQSVENFQTENFNSNKSNVDVDNSWNFSLDDIRFIDEDDDDESSRGISSPPLSRAKKKYSIV